jgi:hypothetical protein
VSIAWKQDWEQRLLSHPDEQFADFVSVTGFDRSREAWRKKRLKLGLQGIPDIPQLQNDPFGFSLSPQEQLEAREILITDNSLQREFNWREWNNWIKRGQTLRRRAKGSPEEEPEISFESDHNVAFIVLGDAHIGAWSTDHDLFERITDEILSIPNLYIALMGDMAHMAIKLRNVVEVGDNLLPSDLQLLYLESWLYEMQDRILFATWGNHEVERAEAQAGVNPFGELYKRTCRHYFNGIGHVTISVNGIPYNIAASHHFQGRSIYSPVHGAQRYLTFNGNDRDIAIAGDSHVPGVMKFVHGTDDRLAVNCGSIQTMSGYAQRYFSLITHPRFPVIVLDNEQKDFWAHWSVREYLKCQK